VCLSPLPVISPPTHTVLPLSLHCHHPPTHTQAKAALCAGCAVVIGLQTTGEAAADALGCAPGPLPGFISTAKELLARFIADHFPIHQAQSPEGEGGRSAGWVVTL
jgi:hypothetical protein